MRHYSSLARPTTLANALTNTSTSLILESTVGYPTSFPFMLIIEPDSVNQEIVDVLSGSGTAGVPYVITRGVDSTTAISHSVGAEVVHGVSARDFAEMQAAAVLGGPTGPPGATGPSGPPGPSGPAGSGGAGDYVPLAGGNMTGSLNITRPAAGDAAYTSNVTGDALHRIIIRPDGKLMWGGGALTQDTNLYRSAVGYLKTDGNMDIGNAAAYLQVRGSASNLTAIEALGSTADVHFYLYSKGLGAISLMPGTTGVVNIGDTTTAAEAYLRLRPGTGLAGGVAFYNGAAQAWLLYRSGPALYVRDVVNAKMQMSFVAGAGAGGGTTDINSALTVAGSATANSFTPTGRPLPGTEVARLLQLTGQNLAASGNAYAIVWDSAPYLPFGGHSTSTNPTRFTFPFAGRYQVFTHVNFLANGTGYRSLYYTKNGANLQYGGNAIVTAVAGVSTSVSLMTTLSANGTTDYIESLAAQASGAALALSTAAAYVATNMVVIYLGP